MSQIYRVFLLAAGGTLIEMDQFSSPLGRMLCLVLQFTKGKAN